MLCASWSREFLLLLSDSRALQFKAATASMVLSEFSYFCSWVCIWKGKPGLPSSKASSSMVTFMVHCFLRSSLLLFSGCLRNAAEAWGPSDSNAVRKDICQKLDLWRIHYTMGWSHSLPVSSHDGNRPCFYSSWASHSTLLRINCSKLVTRSPI